MDLPTLDFSRFEDGSESERTELANVLVDSFEKHGFVKLVNHGVPDEVIYDLFAWSKRFFNLPMETKMEVANERTPEPQRGWSCVGAETTSKLRREGLSTLISDDLTDEKEHFDAGPASDTEYPNKWPNETDLPGFRCFMETCIEFCQNASMKILEAMEVGLHLPSGLLVNRCAPAVSELRLNHYPPITIEKLNQGKARRTWPHSDFGIMTLLFQDAVGGLELEDRRHPGNFVPVIRGSPAEMVINISDTFQRLTNNVIRSGLHQVTRPDGMKKLQNGVLPERYSIVFFVKAGRHTSVGPLPQFVGPERPAEYEDITALQLHKEKTSELY